MAEKVRCINPTGIAQSVDTLPLAPRLDTVDGKNICMSICGEPDITIALEKKLKNDYANVNWTIKKTYGLFPIPLNNPRRDSGSAVVKQCGMGAVALFSQT